MRRKDREIKDINKIRSIVDDCTCMRLGFADGKRAYVVPMNFGYTEQNGDFVFYFHSAKEGRKIDLIKRNGFAAFEMDTNYSLRKAEAACNYSAKYQCVMGEGEVSFIENTADKEAALREIMRHSTGKSNWEFSATALDQVCIFKLRAEEITCKEHK